MPVTCHGGAPLKSSPDVPPFPFEEKKKIKPSSRGDDHSEALTSEAPPLGRSNKVAGATS